MLSQQKKIDNAVENVLMVLSLSELSTIDGLDVLEVVKANILLQAKKGQ